MKRIVSEAEVERRVAEEQAKMAASGRWLPVAMLRAFARTHLELTGPRAAPPHPRPAKPLARPVAAVKPPVPPYLAAERARVCAIIAAAPAGAEAERDEAIRNGASIETFRGVLAGRAILAAMTTGQ